MTIEKQMDRLDFLAYAELGPMPYVEQFLLDDKYEVMPDCSFVKEGKTVPASEVVAALKLQHFMDIKSLAKYGKKVTGFPDKILEVGFDAVISKKRSEHLDKMVEQIRFEEGHAAGGIETYVQAMTGEIRTLDMVVLQHWMKNVKRRMLGLPVSYHIFPVFYGKQGGGKSEGLKKLLGPLSWYTEDVSTVTSLTDERNFKAISEKYVAVLDEMARSAKADAQILKNLISSERMSARALGTNRRDRFVSNCSYVGTSNESLQSIIYDPSGMRRFYEVTCADLCDWQAVNSIDYVSLWKSIDPEKDYLEGHREALKEHQEERRQKDHVEQFISDLGISPGTEAEEYRCSNVQIFQNYLNWAEEYRHTPMNEAALGRALSSRGFKAWRRKGHRGYWVAVEKREASAGGPSWNSYPVHKAPGWDSDPMSGTA